MSSDRPSHNAILARIKAGDISADAAFDLLTSPRDGATRLATGPRRPPRPHAGADGLEQLRERLRSRLREIVAAEAQVPSVRVDPDEPFERYGFDSVMALNVTRVLREAFGELEPTLLFAHQTVASLADFLAERYPESSRRLTGEPSPPPASAAPPVSAPRAESSEVPTPRSQATRGAASRRSADEAIAVVGLSGRFPGADDLDAFWESLAAGRDCITEVPAERWDHGSFFDPSPGRSGKSYSKWGGFLRDIDCFDAAFFHIAPSEAERMDPQERLFLEEVWHALEDAALPRERIAGGAVGVYVGVMYSQYQLYQAEQALQGNFLSLGSSYASIANRVSYLLDLRGPSMAVDSMCSSSLTAIHLACEAIRSGVIEAAIAGGVNLTVHPAKYLDLSRGRFASSDGRCRAFGAGGDGYVPGEGVGAAVLKPLARAEADGDRIHAIIRGSALNHGGKTNGYSVPNPVAQGRLISDALDRAGVEPRAVGYVEAHGTGTSLGDPIEIAGLAAAFGREQAGVAAGACAIGSVKSNIGHLESAAGIAGLVKVVLQMRAGQLAPSLHAGTLNPHIDFGRTPFRVQRELTTWERPATDGGRTGSRIAGISSFGAGGANAHLVVEEYVSAPAGAVRADAGAQAESHLIVLSARTDERLRVLADRVAARVARADVDALPEPELLARVAFTLQVGREPLEERLACWVTGRDELIRALRAFAGRGEADGVLRGRVEVAGDDLKMLLKGRAGVSFVRELVASRDAERLARLWLRGVSIDWRALAPAPPPPLLDLPGYPFARERHWAPPVARPDVRRSAAPALHPLIDRNVSTLREQRFTTMLDAASALVRDHVVDGRCVMPAAALLEMVRAAGALSGLDARSRILDTSWELPVALDPGQPREVSISLAATGSGVAYTVWSRPAGAADAEEHDRLVHARGRLTSAGVQGAEQVKPDDLDIGALLTACGDEILQPARCYDMLAARGLAYGPGFQTLERLSGGAGESLGKVRLPAVADGDADALVLHPVLLDGAFQTLLAFAQHDPQPLAWVPFTLASMDIVHALRGPCWIHAVMTGARSDATRTFDLTVADDAGRVLAQLRGLSVRPVRRTARVAPPAPRAGSPETDRHGRDRVETLTMRPVWTRTPASSGPRVQLRRLLVFEEIDAAPGRHLAAVLGRQRMDVRVLRVRAGGAFADRGEDVIAIEPGNAEHYGRLLERFGTDLPDAIVHAWSRPRSGSDDRAAAGAGDPPALEARMLDAGFYSQLLLAQALMARRPATPVRALYLHPAGPDGVHPAFAAVGALQRTLLRENPAFRFSTLALPAGPDGACAWSEAIAERVLGELAAPGGEDIRWEGDVRLRRALEVVARPPADGPPVLREHGVYLVTGGLGGLGRIFAASLAERVGARLVLSGRSVLDADGEAFIRQLARRRGEARYVQADCGDPEAVRRLVKEATRVFGRLDGVLHLAGTLRDGFVLRKRRADAEAVLAPKVWGACHLDAATQDLPLDFFALASSVTAWMGTVGQADYAFANAFVDEFAVRRERARRAGARAGKTIAIAWPLWAAGGMRVDDAARARIEARFGWVPLPDAEGVRIFEAALRAEDPHWLIFHGHGDRILETVGLDGRAADDRPEAAPLPHRRDGAPDATGAVGHALLAHLQDLVAKALKLPVETLDPGERFERLGIESVMVMNLTRALEETFGELPKTLFFEYTNLRDLSRHLLDRDPERAAARFSVPAVRVPPGPDAVVVRHPGSPPPVDEGRFRSVERGPAPQTRIASVAAADEPIAIVGLSGRYPMAETLDELWTNLREGRDCISEVPVQRWDHAAFFDPEHGAPGKSYTKWGGFLRDVDRFDPLFFNISPREARAMDPQERLFLQVAWQTIEDAGYTTKALGDRAVGVFVGVMYNQYQLYGARASMQARGFVPSSLASSVANRVSFAFDFRGPSLAVDTMCSASLTALHLACASIRNGDCDLALAGGVNLTLHPNKYLQLSQGKFASSDGRCRSFGEGGDGYVPGEGVGAVLLKPLSQALADGDHVYGLVRGSAVNHGGRTNGYSVPTPVAQGAVIRRALERARVHPRDVSYVEAHGTGTSLGDPIEIAGLEQAFSGSGDASSRPRCPIGSIKSNIGHLEAAAGVAALTKVLLQMRHHELAPSIHADQLNPHIRFEESPFYVQRTAGPWQPRGADDGPRPRIAAISSFGAGGSNAHVVIEEYAADPIPAEDAGPELIVLSARTEERLRTYAAALAGDLARRRGTGDRLCDIAYTLQVGREPLAERLALVVADATELARRLHRFADADSRPGDVHRGRIGAEAPPWSALLAGEAGDVYLRAVTGAADLQTLARLWVGGLEVPWDRLHQGRTRRRVSLPAYPFAQDRYWVPDEVPVEDPVDQAHGALDVEPPPAVSSSGVTPASRSVEHGGPSWRRIQDIIIDAAADVLEIPPSELDVHAPHADFGVDSVLAVEIVARINDRLGIDGLGAELRPTDFFNYATIRKLTDYLAGTIPMSAATIPAPAIATPAIATPVVAAPISTTPIITAPAITTPTGHTNDVAIVGLSGRFPDAENVDELWANLAAGRDSVREMPAERWDVAEHWDPDPQAPNKTYSKWAAILDGIDRFDPDFFSLSPREARLIDPQQRLFLMEAWRALEDAGCSDRSLDGAGCHVFVGAGAGDYHHLLHRRGVPFEGYTFMGTHPAVLASRISYHLNLQGPSLAIDTSCSSSLMAVHLACEAIREGRCDLALAGGVAVLVTPDLHVLASKAGMLSPRGRCRAFDHGADGFVPGEAVGAVVLERLDAALRDGHHVYGVIAGSGANHDGKTNGITAPSGLAQTALEVETYRRFGIDPAQIGYVECHGTGTRLGDPIEIDALTQAFRRFTDRSRYCAVGSIKSNVGHTLTAAGIAGLMKTLLCLRHRQLVPTLHVEQPNPYIDFARSPFFVNAALRDWDVEPGAPRLAAVSSFGFSGTNVHLVVREAPAPRPRPSEDRHRARLCAVSAKTDQQLRARLDDLLAWLTREGGRHEWRDIASTLGAGRTHFPRRAAFVARGPDDLRAQIERWLRDGGLAAPGREGDASLETIAARYRAGEDIDWSGLFAGEPCRRIPLPTYPFARESYWVPAVSTAPAVPAAVVRERAMTPAASIAPPPHAPQPLAAGQETVFQRHVGADDPLVRDHVVRGRPLLPAAGHLAIVLGFVRQLLGEQPLTLSRVVFLRPCFVDTSRELQVVIKPVARAGRSDHHLSYEVRSTTGPERVPEVHSRGEVRAADDGGERLPIADILGRCHDERPGAAHYARFLEDGIAYGPQFTTVAQIRYGGSEALAVLERNGDRGPVPAGVLDGAVQCVAAVEWDKRGVYLPFTMDVVHVRRPLPAETYAYVRKLGPGKCHVTIADRSGEPCIEIEEFSYRELKPPVAIDTPPAVDTPPVALAMYVPEWRLIEDRPASGAAPTRDLPAAEQGLIVTPLDAAGVAGLLRRQHGPAPMSIVRLDVADGSHALADALSAAPAPRRIYFLGGLTGGPADLGSLEALERAQELGVRSLFRLIKALLARGRGTDGLRLTVVTQDVHAVVPDDRPRPWAGGLVGLCQSLAKEYPDWRVSCLDVCSGDLRDPTGPAAAAVARAIVDEPPHPEGDPIVWRGGRRYGRILRPVDVPPAGEIPFRREGTFLILGGSGGIGSTLALHLARRAAGRMVLLGRRGPTAQIETTIREIEAAGGQALYLQADATDEASMRAAVAAAKQRFGSIHGAFHSALVLRDARLESMDERTFDAALAPKVRGTAVLARVLRNEPLDFVALFSSAQSFSGNPGQANYSAACTFKDAFGEALRRTGWPVHIVNWGYWGEVGIVAARTYRESMRALGVHSIEAHEGMDALERLLAHRLPQVMPLKAERRVLEQFGVTPEDRPAARSVPTPDRVPPAPAASTSSSWDPLAGLDPLPPLDVAALHRAYTRLDALGAALTVRAFQEMGVLRRAGEVHDAHALARALGIVESHGRLWTTLLDMLASFGYLRDEDGRWRGLAEVEAIASRDLAEEARALADEHPDVRAHVALLRACVEQYPRVLRGHATATEVLFPGSSMEPVERIYRGDPLADHLNDLAGRAVRAYGDAHHPPERLRILEVGAGTGGTTGRVLDLLAPHRDRVEYVYTDVSLGFLRHGRRRFAADHPYVVFEALDIERDPLSQGFVAGGFDVVIAANVLHATRDLAETLHHVSRLVKSAGWLVLSETTAFSPFATLTFGLLDGWWRWRDRGIRIDGSPLASIDTWSGLLRDAGFGRVAVLGPAPRGAIRIGQQVLVAEQGTADRRAEPAGARPVRAEPDAAIVDGDRTATDIEALVAQSVARTLGRDDETLDPERPFMEYGVDSIILVELVNTLNTDLGIDLRATALFDYPSVRELSQYIAQECGPVHGVPASARGTPALDRTADKAGSPVDAGSDDEAASDVELAWLERLARGQATIEETYSRVERPHGE